MWKGFIIGLIIGMPVGPAGAISIRRILAKGRNYGLLSGLGAATADAFYACIAGFGITYVSDFMADNQFWFRLIGGIFIIIMGIKIFLAKMNQDVPAGDIKGLTRAFTTTFFLSVTNPAIIISFAALFAGVGVGSTEANIIDAVELVTGVFVGSLIWWVILSFGINIFREKLVPGVMLIINKALGLVIAGLGFVVLLSIR